MADKFKLVGGRHYRRAGGDEPYLFEKGDIVELNEREQASFGDKFELTTEGPVAEGGTLKEFEAFLATRDAGEPQDEKPAKAEVEEPAAAASGPSAAWSNMVDKIGLGPATAFTKAGISSISQAKKLSDDELIAIKGVGAGTVTKLRGG